MESCLIPAAVAAPLREEDFTQGALYDALEERCGVRILLAEESFSAITLGAYEAELLQVPPGAPALSVERVAYAPGRHPVELRLGTLRGDRCRFRIELR